MNNTYRVIFQNGEGKRKSCKKAEDITFFNCIRVNYADIELIAKIEALGTWEEEYKSFDVWSWNGKYYKIYKHD